MPATTTPLPPMPNLDNPAPSDETAPVALDRMLHAWQSNFTAGRSPSTVSLAFLDWAAHAANSPFETAALGGTALVQWQRLARAAMDGEKAISPPPGDHRFDHPAWQARPYSLLTQAVLLGEEWWESVVSAPGGVDPNNERIAAFAVRQWLDLVSPSNFPWLNPEVIEATRIERRRQPRGGNAELATRPGSG